MHLTIKNNRLLLQCDFSEKEKAKSIRGYSWLQNEKKWSYLYSEEKLFEIIKKLKPELSEELKEHIYQYQKTKEKIKAIHFLSDVKIEIPFANLLFPYQRVGSYFLSETKNAGIFDEMGIGKTIQLLTACEILQANKILIICPKSVIYVWKNEIKKWLGVDEDKISVIVGNKNNRKLLLQKQAKYIITNYEIIRIDTEMFLDYIYDVIIIDEAHKIKNRKALQTKAIKKLKSKYKFVATGTPILNSPDELWSLLNFINPDEFSSYWNFVEKYCYVFDNPHFGYKEILGIKNEKELKEKLSYISIRRKKSEVLQQLPEKFFQSIEIDLSEKEGNLYNSMLNEMYVEIAGKEISATVVLAQLTRLKQLTVHPKLLNEEYVGDSTKFETIFDLTSEYKENKIVIFSQFAKAILLLEDYLMQKNIKIEKIIGSMTQEERKEAQEKFWDKSNILAGTIGAMGFGINLSCGDICIFLDKVWTPANNNQAIDRLHRIGQKKNILVISLVAKDTVDESIEKVLKRKINIARKVLDRDFIESIYLRCKQQK